jgi:hypothetical protein
MATFSFVARIGGSHVPRHYYSLPTMHCTTCFSRVNEVAVLFWDWQYYLTATIFSLYENTGIVRSLFVVISPSTSAFGEKQRIPLAVYPHCKITLTAKIYGIQKFHICHKT